MTAPTLTTRKATAVRDHHRCVLCGAMDALQWNHRRQPGMGGSRIVPPAVDGNILCAICNQLIEADAKAATIAKAYGIKVLKWVASPDRVPQFYPMEQKWFRLEGVTRVEITAVVAHEMMSAAYGWDTWIRWFQEAKS